MNDVFCFCLVAENGVCDSQKMILFLDYKVCQFRSTELQEVWIFAPTRGWGRSWKTDPLGFNLGEHVSLLG